MSITKKQRLILIICAVLLAVAAIVWRAVLDTKSESAKLSAYLNNNFDYHVSADSIYIAAAWDGTSISELLAGDELDYIVELSKDAGFSSNINKVGDITLVLCYTDRGDIATLYIMGSDIELGFAQSEDGSLVYKLGEYAPAGE